MASVTAFTAARMKEIEDTTVVGGLVDVNGHLLLSTREGEEIDAGYVKGDAGTDAIISAVSVETLLPTQDATIDVGGTPSNRSFAFGIPKGDKGDTGNIGPQGDSALNAGTISLWGGEVAPSNWLLCDGAAYSRTTYATLFNAIGTKYGVGDGSTTFNVPNLKGRTPIGKDTTQTEFDNLGETGGAKTHSHPLGAAGQALIALAARTTNQIVMRRIATASIAMTHAISTTNLGSGAVAYATAEAAGAQLAGATDSVTDLPPYQVVNFIIKYSAGQTPSDSELATRVGTLESQISSNAQKVQTKTRLIQRLLSGGGVRKATATGVGWSQRFISLGHGVDSLSPSGYFDIGMPADGEIIQAHNMAVGASVTVAGGIIPLPTWCGLYYDPPLGGIYTTDPARFHLVGHASLATPFEIPSTWILIALRNTDTLSPTYTWGDGRQQDYWKVFNLTSWSDYGGEYETHGWRIKDDGDIQLKGLIKGGAFSTLTNYASWGTSMAPEARRIFICPSVTGHARVDVNAAGEFFMYAGYNTGAVAWVDLSQVSWTPIGV